MSETGLRERKKRATRSALAAAALELAAERGVEHVTADDIAAAVGVSTRTFFNYFATKEEAFVADDVDRAHRFLAEFAALPLDSPPWLALREVALRVVTDTDLPAREQALKERVVRASPPVLLEQVSQYAKLEGQLVEELARRCGEPADSLLPWLLASSVTAAIRAAAEAWLAAPAPIEFHDVLDAAFAQLAPAFAHIPDPPGP